MRKPLLRRRERNDNPEPQKPFAVRFCNPNGTEQTLAMGPGDDAAWGGTRVRIEDAGRISVTPYPE